ncbi:hypothetical protein JW960_16085 [candidate division KSB1 bacterium]|nr:hypothetical protein [candidate division KSB1 bacterium]
MKNQIHPTATKTQKKHYQKPAIVHISQIQTLAGSYSATWAAHRMCRKLELHDMG